jgi:hypothetical protein
MRVTTIVGLAILVLLVTGCGRSDTAVTAGVKVRLAADEIVQARHLDVDTNGGVVTLSGRVDTPDERSRAMQVAAASAGVVRVIDHMEVVAPAERSVPTTGELPLPDHIQ